MEYTYFDQVVDRGELSGSYSTKWNGFASRFKGYDVENDLPMWVADMDFLCPPTVIEAVIKRARHGIYGYTNQSSVNNLIVAASRWADRRYGWKFEPEWGIFSNGVVAAINASIQEFTREGDAVIIQRPVYYPFYDGVVNTNRKVQNNPLIEKNGKYFLDFEGLESLAKQKDTKMLILCNPHNPVGRVWTKDELIKIAKICCDNDLILFSDEIHADLIFSGYKHIPMGTLGKKIQARLITSYAPSKTFNLAGLSSAVIVIPNDTLRERLKKRFLANRYPKSNAFGPIAGAVAYNTGDEYVSLLDKYVEDNMLHAVDYMQKYLPGIKAEKIEGTYLLWVDLRGLNLSDDEAYRFMLEKAKVAGDLGIWFGKEGGGFIRLNIACPRTILDEALKRMRRALENRGENIE